MKIVEGLSDSYHFETPINSNQIFRVSKKQIVIVCASQTGRLE